MALLLRTLGLALALLVQPMAPAAHSQTPGAQPTEVSSGVPWAQVAQVGALITGAYLGAVVARRYFASGWMALIGARLGAGLGLETAAAAGALGVGLGSALPAARTAAPQLIAAPGSGCTRSCWD